MSRLAGHLRFGGMRRAFRNARASPTAFALVAVVALAVFLASAALAQAEEGAISITGSTTVPRGLHGSFHIGGTALGPNQYGYADNEVSVIAVPAAEACATTGTQSSIDSRLGFSATVQGPAPFDYTWEPPVENYVEVGTYALCASLYRNFDYMTGARMTFTVVKPEFRMKESVPAKVRVGRRTPFSVHGWLQAPAYLETQILPPKILICGAEHCHYKKIHKCASTRQAEERMIQGSESVDYPFYSGGDPLKPVAAGAFHFSRRLVARSAGIFRMCSWLVEQGENRDPARLFATAKWRVTK